MRRCSLAPASFLYIHVYFTLYGFNALLIHQFRRGCRFSRQCTDAIISYSRHALEASSALGLMVGCLSPSMEVANLAGPALIVVSLMLSGVRTNNRICKAAL